MIEIPMFGLIENKIYENEVIKLKLHTENRCYISNCIFYKCIFLVDVPAIHITVENTYFINCEVPQEHFFKIIMSYLCSVDSIPTLLHHVLPRTIIILNCLESVCPSTLESLYKKCFTVFWEEQISNSSYTIPNKYFNVFKKYYLRHYEKVCGDKGYLFAYVNTSACNTYTTFTLNKRHDNLLERVVHEYRKFNNS